jgi:hypothetical protein
VISHAAAAQCNAGVVAATTYDRRLLDLHKFALFALSLCTHKQRSFGSNLHRPPSMTPHKYANTQI